MKLLLTGSTGFVGRNLLLRALAENRYDEIWVPVRSREKLVAQFVGDGFETIPSRVCPAVTSAPDWNLSEVPPVDHVVHSAGLISARSREEYFKANVEGTVELFRRIPRPKKAILLSSLAAAGPCRKGLRVRREGDEDVPVTWYGESKLEMERVMRQEFTDLNYLCLRPPMVLGPRDKATLPLFKMVRQPLFFKAGFRSKYYSFISVFDLTSAVFSALDDDGDWSQISNRSFFVASETPVSDRELLTSVARTSHRTGLILSVPEALLRGITWIVDSVPMWRARIPNLTVDRAKDLWPNRWVVSSQAFQERFRWRPFENLHHTLQQTRDWYVRTGQLPA